MLGIRRIIMSNYNFSADFAPDYGVAIETMIKFVRDRSAPDNLDSKTRLRYPVALFFIRGDRGGKGKVLAEECIASLNYWDLDSGNYIDILLPGWKRLGGDDVFDIHLFYQFKNEIEALSKWRFCGESEIFLVNFDFFPLIGKGMFTFDETISLPVEEMIRKGITTSVDALLNEIISVAKQIDNGSVWEISDKLGYQRARKSLWEYLKIKITGGLAKVYDDLRPFAVCNLEVDS